MATLEETYNKYKGQAVLAPGGGAGNQGQCLQWSDIVLNEVYGLPFIYTPAALDWWVKAGSLGLTVHFNKIPAGSPVKKGDFVIYDARVGAPEGHIDVASNDGSYNDFTAYDSNWGGKAFYNSAGYPTLHEVRHNDKYNGFIVGYLRSKEANVLPDFNNGDAENLFVAMYGNRPTPEQIAAFVDWAKNNKNELLYETIIRRFKELTDAASKAQPAQELKPGIYQVK